MIIEAQPAAAIVRLKGLRSGYSIDYSTVYAMAAKKAVEDARRSRPMLERE